MDVKTTKFNFFANTFPKSENEIPEFELNMDESANLFTRPVVEQGKPALRKDRLNAYDTKILEEPMNREAGGGEYELDRLAKNIQKEISACDEKINSSRFFADNNELKSLYEKKDALSSQLNGIKKEIKKINTTQKITDFISNSLNLPQKTQEEMAEKINNFLGVKNFAPMFSGLYKQSKLQTAITNLNTIQANVLGLINSSVPYGESEKHYETLAIQILKANKLQHNLKRDFS